MSCARKGTGPPDSEKGRPAAAALPEGKDQETQKEPTTTAGGGPVRETLEELGFKVHPAAELFPLMGEEETNDLSADIDQHDLREPLKFTKINGSLHLIDGRNRILAIARIKDEAKRNWLLDRIRQGKVCLPVFPPDPVAYVISANLHRRHLTSEQKREIIARLVKEDPGRSDRATAKIAHVDHTTVASVRAKVEANGGIHHKPERTEASGRKARGRKPGTRRLSASPPRPSEPKPAGPTPAQRRDMDVTQFCRWFEAKPKATLADFGRLIGGFAGPLATVPQSERVAAARAILRALNLSPDDLRAIDNAPLGDRR